MGNTFLLTDPGGASGKDDDTGDFEVIDEQNEASEDEPDDRSITMDDIEWTDNNTLAFLGSEGVLSTLGTINANGGSMKIQLKPGGPVIDAFEITSNGSYLLNVESPVHPHELYSMEKGKSELERITDSNPWLTKFK